MAHRILAMFRVLKSYTVGAAAQHSESKASGMIPFAMATAHSVLEMPCSLKSYTFTAMAMARSPLVSSHAFKACTA